MWARLIVEAGVAEPGAIDLSPEMPVTLGRKRNNTILLRDSKASRFHAEVFFADGTWCVRNCSTTNPTRLDGIPIAEVTRLHGGQVIGVGATRIRFDAAATEAENGRPPLLVASEEPRIVAVPLNDSTGTRLDPDELTALFNFMNASLAETTPHSLVMLALRTVQDQTQAAICGFVSFDADDSQLKVVLPAEAEVDVHLSRQLTLKVGAEGCSAWLTAMDTEAELLKSVTLAAYLDALCVPLRRSPAAELNGTAGSATREGPLGALHAYHASRRFSIREVRFCEVLAGCLANALNVLRSRRALLADNSRLRDQGGRGGDELIGGSKLLQQLRTDIANLAVHSFPVRIEGESGVGKELVALALHRLSPRREGPLVTVNCAGLNTNRVEVDLFGHERGAYTGADRARTGLFQQADEGTLFLDEIGELSLENQARLLRVLETKKVRPIGAKSEITVDVRIIAATNRDLEKEVKAERFRRDLLYRLGTRLHVRPLREHAEDIPALAAHFVAKFNNEYRRQIRLSPETEQRLQAYSWPGNVRQLRSVLETAIAMTPGDVLRPSSLRLQSEDDEDCAGEAPLNLDEVEKRAIAEALRRTGGVVVQAARILGIHRETLIKKAKKYGIRAPEDATNDAALE